MFELVHSASFDSCSARGIARIPADLPVLADHFPDLPVLPGSLQIELCAQLAGPLAEQTVAAQDGVERWAFLAMVRSAVFHAPVLLPAELAIQAEVRRVETATVLVAASLARDGARTCRVELVMAMQEAPPAWAAGVAAARARVAVWRLRA